jgi:hypothetical protein
MTLCRHCQRSEAIQDTSKDGIASLLSRLVVTEKASNDGASSVDEAASVGREIAAVGCDCRQQTDNDRAGVMPARS